ncbi:uncharacterized protein EDB93DRAFT_1177587 [Suillus bovinus]|uniref:uncharacterized protein n=1 Tax=Suillus bovinus TaxID=48563 RepID=UPI001B865B86|nr:uncharacterized protein EDB93DRAFT_1177587 [Suillus bovinus]KAG2131705.1 hypothetical protein EDB93DRAFT_1177587 [Suillus bovinus]
MIRALCSSPARKFFLQGASTWLSPQPAAAMSSGNISADHDTLLKLLTLPLTKKRRISESVRELQGPLESESAPGKCLFPTLPLELLAEILIQTDSPRDVLSVARTSKLLCSTLVCNPAADFIWRTIRKNCLPYPLPDPTPNFSEAAYAAFVYDGGPCDVCKRDTKEFYASFATRIRLCRDSRCKTNIRNHLTDVTTIFKGHARDEIWIPYVESTCCFDPSLDNAWPENPTILMKKSEWERFRADYAAFSALSPPPSEALRKACTDQIAKFPKVMEFAVALQKWKCTYVTMHRTIKSKNEKWAKALAAREGWNEHDLLNSQSYGSLHRHKNYVLEEVTLRDFLPMKPLIEAQLLRMQTHRQNQENEASYRQRRDDVKQYYDRLRSAGTVVPTLHEFRKLSVMTTMQGSVTGSRPNSSGLAKDMKNSALIAELVAADLRTWMASAREKLSELLGFPKWRSASKTKLHPLDRITARFRCQGCGKVAKRYETERCLDFAGVCAHECPSNDKKDRKPVDWSVDRFIKDEKASNAVARLLTLIGITDEDANACNTVKMLGAHIRCLSCEHAFIVMDFSTLIGHAHRHDNMQMTIVSKGEGPEHAFEAGLSAKLLDMGFTSQKLRSEANYRCRHCVPTSKSAEAGMDGQGQVSTGESIAKESHTEGFQTENQKRRHRNKKSKLRSMDFNALRSHLKELHRVEMVSDEDFFVQTPAK